MQVLVTFRHMDATPALRRYAETKVQRVHKLMRHPIEAHVILEVVKRQHTAEITLSGEHLHITAKEATADLYSAIDLAMTKVERQVQKHVTKRLTQRHDALPVPAAAKKKRRAATPAVKREQVIVELLTVAEAVKRISREGTEFVLFQNEATDALSVLYRRKGGGYGIIEPEIVDG
ncbi:MAG: ribosome-associated translation inhibitor RaiA [bacterium]